MDTFSNVSDTSSELPLSEADQAALRSSLLHDLGVMLFRRGEVISRTLWVVFIGGWGAWTHAALPIDDRLDVRTEENVAGLCDVVGTLISPPDVTATRRR